MIEPNSDVVGLVPAAGMGTRLGPLPCSKELYPIGFRRDEKNGDLRAEVASHHLFEKFRTAGIPRAFVVLRSGKWDIPAYFGDGTIVGLSLAYLVIPGSLGPPDTMDRARPFIGDKLVAFGFPDILFGPDDVFEALLRRLRESDADVVLGLYHAHDVRWMDMADVDDQGRVRSLVLKPATSELRYAWLCATWRATFTDFMHRFVMLERGKADAERSAYRSIDARGDLPVGAVFKAAIEEGLRVHGIVFPDEAYFDIGSPENLIAAMRTIGTPAMKPL